MQDNKPPALKIRDKKADDDEYVQRRLQAMFAYDAMSESQNSHSSLNNFSSCHDCDLGVKDFDNDADFARRSCHEDK